MKAEDHHELEHPCSENCLFIAKEYLESVGYKGEWKQDTERVIFKSSRVD